LAFGRRQPECEYNVIVIGSTVYNHDTLTGQWNVKANNGQFPDDVADSKTVRGR